MRVLRRILAASGLTGTIAALAFAAPAGAAAVDRIKGACLTRGIAKVNPPIPFVGGTGGYTYDSVVECVGVELSKGTNVAVNLVHLDVTSPGSYTNIVCGTGKAVSTPNGTTVTAAQRTSIFGVWKTNTLTEWTAVVADMDHAVEFVSFNGVLKWTDTPAQKGPDLVPKVLTSGPSGFPGGTVTILPDPAKGSVLPGACTKAFQVTAYLEVDWSPANPIV